MSLVCEKVMSPMPTAFAAVERQLNSSPYWAIRQLACHAGPDYLTVCGTLPSYYLKQVVESLVSKLGKKECVKCDIEVQAQ